VIKEIICSKKTGLSQREAACRRSAAACGLNSAEGSPHRSTPAKGRLTSDKEVLIGEDKLNVDRTPAKPPSAGERQKRGCLNETAPGLIKFL